MRYIIILCLFFLAACSSTPELDKNLSSSEISTLQECNFILKYGPEEVLTPIYFKLQYPKEVMVWKNTESYYNLNVYDHEQKFTLNYTTHTFGDIMALIETYLPCESYK